MADPHIRKGGGAMLVVGSMLSLLASSVVLMGGVGSDQMRCGVNPVIFCVWFVAAGLGISAALTGFYVMKSWRLRDLCLLIATSWIAVAAGATWVWWLGPDCSLPAR